MVGQLGDVEREIDTNKEYEILMDAARTHMNAAQSYFEAAKNIMMVTNKEDQRG